MIQNWHLPNRWLHSLAAATQRSMHIDELMDNQRLYIHTIAREMGIAKIKKVIPSFVVRSV